MKDSGFVRLFVAIGVCDDVRRGLAAVLELLRATRAHVAWVAPGNLHLSLAFLGNIPADMVPLLGAALDEAVRCAGPFAFEVCGLGWFGGASSPRVLWAGVRPCRELMRLREAVSAELRGLDVQLDDRPFLPHVTLGRVRSRRGREELLDAISHVKGREFGPVAVSGVDLMRSVLDPGGARYSVLHRAGFAVD